MRAGEREGERSIVSLQAMNFVQNSLEKFGNFWRVWFEKKKSLGSTPIHAPSSFPLPNSLPSPTSPLSPLLTLAPSGLAASIQSLVRELSSLKNTEPLDS